MIKKHPVIFGTILALTVAWLICRKEVKLLIDVTNEMLQSIEMIDPKYLDMLRQQPSIEDKLHKFITETIDKLVIGGICKVADQPVPKELGLTAIHIGTNRLTKRQLIAGDMGKNQHVCVEFSADFKKGYLAKRDLLGYEELVLSESTSIAAKSLFDSLKQRLAAIAHAALPDDPKRIALEEFLSETRYGTNEYLCNEFHQIYKQVIDRLTESIDDADVRETIIEALSNLEITDIRQFMSDNGINPDNADVHVID